jgi:hypothetical protein
MRFLSAVAALLLFVTAPVPAQTFTVPVEYFKLDNGLKVVVSTDRSAPVVLVEVIYNIGFRVEPKGRTGFAHLFEHMMFQGSANVKKMEHVSLMQEAGGIVNGSTRFDYTNYFQSLPSNGLERALFLEADRMRSLDVTAENLKNQQIGDEWGEELGVGQVFAAGLLGARRSDRARDRPSTGDSPHPVRWRPGTDISRRRRWACPSGRGTRSDLRRCITHIVLRSRPTAVGASSVRSPMT